MVILAVDWIFYLVLICSNLYTSVDALVGLMDCSSILFKRSFSS